MMIFVNEERPYTAWLARHRDGFVADWLRKPTRKRPVVHRATCPSISRKSGRSKLWTTGRHVKACGLDLAEMQDWVRNDLGFEPDCCSNCRPENAIIAEDVATNVEVHDHVTRLGKEIVDCVLDVAVVCLDDRPSEYSLTVGDIAQLLGKTPGQITTAILRLFADEYLATDAALSPRESLAADRLVYPTTKALRTLPAFREMRIREVEVELHGLHPAGA